MTAVSACLCGVKCRYDENHKYNESLVQELMKQGAYIPICPEILGGLSTPRIPCEIKGGTGRDVISGQATVTGKDGGDYTVAFLKGGEAALKICMKKGVTAAYLQQKSPSCGCGLIYNGNFSGETIPGNGVFAQMLLDNGVMVISV